MKFIKHSGYGVPEFTSQELRNFNVVHRLLFDTPVLEKDSEIVRRLTANDKDEIGVEVILLMDAAYNRGLKNGRRGANE